MIYYLFVAFGVFACSASQLLLKKSANLSHNSAVYEVLNWRVVLAYTIMLVTLVANIFAMSHGVLLKDLPILESLGYVFVPILSAIFFNEHISKQNIIVICIILLGIIINYV